MPLLFLLLAVLAMQQPAPTRAPATATLDYDYFKTRVQPIFLAKRPGHARCVTCHANGQPNSENLQ